MKECNAPFFSIIIPTYRRTAPLGRCLEGITRLDYPKERFEVIVVDDGSPMSPEKTVLPFAAPLELTLLKSAHAGPAAARNKGAARAKGEFLVFTDDDCIPLPDWLYAFSKRFAISPDSLVGGAVINSLPANPCSSASQLLCDYLYAYYNREENNAQFLMSSNMALMKDLFIGSGGFDTDFYLAGGEDRAFSSNWLNHGHRIVYAPEAVVLHAHPLTFKAFIKQHFAYGRGAFLFHLKQNRSGSSFGMAPLSFYSNLLRYPYLFAPKGKKVLFGALFIISQMAVAAGHYFERMGRDRGRGDLGRKNR